MTEDGKKLPLDVKAGDRILFGKYSGTEVKIDDEEYLIMNEEDVLGILDVTRIRQSPFAHRRKQSMPKQLKFNEEARAALLRGRQHHGRTP